MPKPRFTMQKQKAEVGNTTEMSPVLKAMKTDSKAVPFLPSAPTLLIMFSVIAVLSRIWYTIGQSVTFDEFYEVELAKDSLSNIVYRGDGFPPLYSVLMYFWQQLFGERAGIASARALSIVFGAACCPAIYFTTRRAACEKAALVAAGLIAVLPIHMFYTAEARSYSLLLLITCLATNAALKAIESRTCGAWVVFAVFAALGMYTHYLFAGFVGIVLLVGLIQGRDGWTVVSGAVLVSLSLPLILFWSKADFDLQQGWTYQIPFGLGELCFTYSAFVFGYTVGPSTRELHPMHFSEAALAIAPWALVVAAAGLGLLMTARLRLPSDHSTPLLLSLCGFGPALTGMACMTFEVGYQVRYVVWAIIPVIVFLSYLIVQAWHHRVGKYSTIALVVLFLIAGFSRSGLDRYRNEDVGAAASFFQDDPALKRPIVVVSGYMVEPFKYYLDSSWTLTGIPMTFDFEDREEEFDNVITKHVLPEEVVWFVYTREFHEDPDGVLFKKMEKAAELELVKNLAGLKVYRATVKRTTEG